MNFLAPHWLALLALVAALAIVYVVLQRRRRHFVVRFTDLDLLAGLAPRRPGWRRHVAAGLVGASTIAVVLGLARPSAAESIPRDTATVVLAIDVSPSMAATDVAPTRLDAARQAAIAFVDELPDGFHVGLVTFGGTAQVLAVPTTDHTAVIDALGALTTNNGTAAGEGIEASLVAIETAAASTTPAATEDGPIATIVLLSDGATTKGRTTTDAAAAAADAGVTVSTITYGTATGTVEFQGETVLVPPDPAAMTDVATTTGGVAFTATTGDELADVYDEIQTTVGYTTEQRELTTAFLVAGIVTLLAGVAAGLVWTGRFL